MPETEDIEEQELEETEEEQEQVAEVPQVEVEDLEDAEEQEEEEQTEEEPQATQQAEHAPDQSYWSTAPVITEEDVKQLQELFDQDQIQAIVGLVTRVADRRVQTERQVQRAIQAAGLSQSFTVEYGEELEQSLNLLPPEIRAHPDGVKLAAVGAIHARAVKTHGDLAAELIRAAKLLGAKTAPQSTAKRTARRDAVPAARMPAQVVRRSQPATRGRNSYFAEQWGLTDKELERILREEG